MEDVNKVAGGCALSLVAIVAGVLLSGFTLAMLWGWFVVPSLGLPPLGILQAYGIAIVAAYFKAGLATHETEEMKTARRAGPTAVILPGLVNAVGYNALFLALGWVVQLFI